MKLIDWTKVPTGTMTTYGEVLLVNKSTVPYVILFDGEDCRAYYLSNLHYLSDLRVVPQTRWTYHDGGECPVPEGLTFEHITRKGFEWRVGEYSPWRVGENSLRLWDHCGPHDIIAYRVVGVDRAGGWTDDPSEVASPVEIISQTSHTVGNVGVSFTVGRVKP